MQPFVSSTELEFGSDGGGPWTASISLNLAKRCTVCTALLDLLSGGDEESATNPEAPPCNTLAVPGVPDTVPANGISALDDWATRAAGEGASCNWLPSFLAAGVQQLPAAAVAAAFLGCQSFLELYLEVQLLRVALMKNVDLWQPDRGPRNVPPLSSLREEDFRKLPCVQASGPSQSGQSSEPSSEPQAPTVQEELPSESPDALRGASSGPSAADGPTAVSTGSSWGDWARGLWQRARGSSQQRVWELQPRCSPQQMEQLVVALLAGNMLAVTGAQEPAVREVLYRLGLRPTLSARREGHIRVHQGREPYLQLPLLEDEEDPSAGPSIAAAYEVESVAVEVESHDQGWSSYPEDRNSYRNSWTWGELAVVGPDGQPVRREEPGRLYTNLHAVSRPQTHRVSLPSGSEVVQDLNRWALAREQSPPAACSAPSAASESGAAPAQPAQGGQGGHQLVLFACAAFPGWVHTVQRAEVVVNLRPRRS